MNNLLSIHTFRFLLLILLQVLIFNNIHFLGYINPYVYLLFIALFQVNNNRMVFIFLSFLMGLILDIFMDTGGIHSGACVFIAYIRPVILKFSFGSMYEHLTVKFNSVDLSSKLIYFSLITSLHHLVLFSLEIFSFSKLILVFQKTLFSSIFTILICMIITIIFSKKTK